ncbi:hypothetical protein DMUE_1246 [Dictyocoela muelleri]|nr:hypothetical protein DMUE_1246 [Dictyocoela muelleri]
MTENSKDDKDIFKKDEKQYSQPLKPSNIPQKQITEDEKVQRPHDYTEDYKKSITEFQNILDMDVGNELFVFLHMPMFIVVFTFTSYLAGRLQFGIPIFIFVAYASVCYFRRRMKRFKDSMTCLVYKQARRKKVENNWETTEWVNYIIERVWNEIEETVSIEVMKNVNPILHEKCPPGFSRLRLSRFTLGSTAPTISGICFYDREDLDVIQLDAEVSFVPLEIGKSGYNYITRRKCQTRQWNSKIILVARLGTRVKGIGVDLPIMVKDLSFSAKARIILRLTKKIPFLKELEFCFLDLPKIEFNLRPLKTVDVMDVPGLSRWINSIINSSMKKMLVNPNSIKIDLEKTDEIKSFYVGIILVSFYETNYSKAGNFIGQIEMDGQKLYHTGEKTGPMFAFNEYFYLLTENINDIIGMKVYGHGLGNDLLGETTLNVKKIRMISNVYEKLRFWKTGELIFTIDSQSSFFPITTEITNCAIVSVKIIQVVDLQFKNSTKDKVYDTYFTIIACPKIPEKKEEEVANNPFKILTSTAFFMGDAILSAGKTITSLVPGLGDESEKLLPFSKNTFFVGQTKKILESNAPKFYEKFSFFATDLKNDYVYLSLKEDDTDNIGRVEIPLKGIKNGHESWHNLKDLRSGKVKLKWKVKYINLEPKKEFKNYEKVIKVTITDVKTIYDEGVYYIVIENDDETQYVPPFCTNEFPINRIIFIPIETKPNIKFSLFKENEREDDFIGSGYLFENGEITQSVNSSPILGQILTREIHLTNDDEDAGSIFIETEESELRNYKKNQKEKDLLKIVQMKINHFDSAKDCYVEFKTDKILNRMMTRNKKLYEKMTIFIGKSQLSATFKTISGEMIGSCIVPIRNCTESVMISSEKYCEVDVRVGICDFYYYEPLERGTLALKIIKCIDLLGVDRSGLSDPYVRIFHNGNKIYKTVVKKQQLNPIFEEETIFEVFKSDIIRLEVVDYNMFEKSKLISYIEFPLYFLKEGTTSFGMSMVDAKSLRKSKAKIYCGFRFFRV